MWGFGGRYYWGRRERLEKVEGIVVAFAWMSSQERHLKRYVDMYSSLGWNSLVCHSEFLNMWVQLPNLLVFFFPLWLSLESPFFMLLPNLWTAKYHLCLNCWRKANLFCQLFEISSGYSSNSIFICCNVHLTSTLTDTNRELGYGILDLLSLLAEKLKTIMPRFIWQGTNAGRFFTLFLLLLETVFVFTWELKFWNQGFCSGLWFAFPSEDVWLASNEPLAFIIVHIDFLYV